MYIVFVHAGERCAGSGYCGAVYSRLLDVEPLGVVDNHCRDYRRIGAFETLLPGISS